MIKSTQVFIDCKGVAHDEEHKAISANLDAAREVLDERLKMVLDKPSGLTRSQCYNAIMALIPDTRSARVTEFHKLLKELNACALDIQEE